MPHANGNPPIDPETGKQFGSHVLKHGYTLREIAFNQALALNDCSPKDTKERIAIAQAIKSLVQSWDTATERIRILRGRPLPGSRRPPPKEKVPRKSRSVVVTETITGQTNPTPTPTPTLQPVVSPASENISSPVCDA